MAARATLIIGDELSTAFHAASQDGKTRWMCVKIEGETMNCVATSSPSTDAETDFASMRERMVQNPNDACYYLVCTNPNSLSDKVWVLYSYIPGSAVVREKMLYAASKEHLKRTLGSSLFAPRGVEASGIDDVTYAGFLEAFTISEEDKPLTENETIAREEAAASQAERSAVAKAMGVMPFSIAEDLREAVKQFSSGELTWVEMRFNAETESVTKGQCKSLPADAALGELVDAEEPRFYALSRRSSAAAAGGGDKPVLYFIFSCPDAAPVRMKMSCSTCKSTILSILGAEPYGITFDKTVNIRSPEDLDEEIKEAATEVAAPSKQKLTHAHVKPRGPKGRRKASRRPKKHIFGSLNK